MEPQEKYDVVQRHSAYTSDPEKWIEFFSDLQVIHRAWNTVEFGGQLKSIPTIPTDDYGYGVLGGDGILSGDAGCVLGHFVTYTATGDRLISVDTTSCILHAMHEGRALYSVAAEVLLHEMVHQFCAEQGIEDADADGTHNARFRDAARAHGLTCRVGSQGFNRTRVKPGHWAPLYACLGDARSPYDPWNVGDWRPTIASKMRTSHVTEDLARIFMFRA